MDIISVQSSEKSWIFKIIFDGKMKWTSHSPVSLFFFPISTFFSLHGKHFFKSACKKNT